MSKVPVLGGLLMLVAAGCVAPAAPLDAASSVSGDGPLASLAVAGATRLADGALLLQGRELTGMDMQAVPPRPVAEFMSSASGDMGCDEVRCETTTFRVDAPGTFEVAVQAEDSDQDYSLLAPERSTPVFEYLTDTTFFFRISLVDAEGHAVGEVFNSGHQASLAIVEDAPAGDYALTVIADSGTASYQAVFRALAPEPAPTPEPDGAILPDLRLEKPYNLLIDAPIGREAAFALGATQGCGADETTGAQATRCLRYATRIVNAGPGDFEERLSVSGAMGSHAMQEARWRQRIDLADGSTMDVDSGLAEYHPVHGHYHLNGLQRAFVHAYDETTKARGELVAEGQKTGLCMVDGGIADITKPVQMPSARDAGCCYYAGFCELDRAFGSEDFVQGISPGWFDTYPWWRADQYVDIAGLPDGTYEFVSVVDPDGIVREDDETNNEASVVFRLTGDSVVIAE